MVAPSWIIDPDAIRHVEGHDFEHFCYQLLEFELHSRHSGPEIHGPPRTYARDQGMDIEIVIHRPPRISKEDFPAALTEDGIGVSCVACKSGREWRDGLLEDVGKQVAIEVVRQGGQFLAMVHLKLAATEKSELVEALSGKLAKELDQSANAVAGRIPVIDANRLATFYAYHWFALDPRTRQLLNLPRLDGLADYEEWIEELRHIRGFPEFVADEPRKAALEQLARVLTHDAGQSDVAQAIWVYGPPGTGKTRIVAEALGVDLAISKRVLVSREFDYGARAVSELDVPTFSSVIMVVDECPPDRVAALAAQFMARARGQGGRLILIGPQDALSPPTGFSGPRLLIKPLEAAAARQLVERELGVGSGSGGELVERVLRLTEGYPWFAVLLARALRSDPTALPDGSTHWDAAQLAIAGPPSDYGGNRAAWEEEVSNRSKALLAIVLTEGVDWNRPPEDYPTRLGLAFDMPWSAIKETAERCWRRGLVRVRQNWRYKYVTPNNLARLVACHLLEAPLSLGRLIREHVPELTPDLYRRLEALEVPGVLLDSLAEEDLRPFVDNPSLDQLSALPLTFLARRRPGVAARILRRAIDDAELETLRSATEIRRDLVFALEHICRRKDGFEDAEPALFRLALAENETYANNATGVWSHLFMGALSLTHRSFDARLEILGQRLQAQLEEGRRLALKGLEYAIGPEDVGPMFTEDDRLDGPWLEQSPGEIRQGKEKAWQMLFELTEDSALGDEARSLAIRNLRTALRWGIGEAVLSGLAERASGWSDQQQADLRQDLGDVKRYEQGAMAARPEVEAALNRLAAAVGPGDYHAKMLDTVGQWMPGEAKEAENHREVERRLDEELAREGLALPDIPLAAELEWLDSEKAVRAVPFMYRVGAVDGARLLLQPLIDRARTGAALQTLSAYLGGVAEVGGGADVDGTLRSWRGDASLAPHTLLTVWRVGASDERVAWLVEDLEAGRLDPELIGCLALGSWGTGATPESMWRLIETLSRFPSTTPQLTALDLLMAQLRVPDVPQEMVALLEQLVQSLAPHNLSAMAADIWQRGCSLLVRRGRLEAALQAALSAIASAEHYGVDREAWQIVSEVLAVDPGAAWSSITSLLEEHPEVSYRIGLELRGSEILSQIPADGVLEWVGQDASRSVLVALICEVHSAPLSDVARRLIERFGPESPAAHELSARAHSTPGVVSSIAGFARSQLENARAWAEDPSPPVAEWGRRMVEELQASYDYHAADEEFEQRQRG
ncbi:MAG: hypothetical protein WBF66_07255 [Dehalococcoidia bacterium]